MTDEQIEALAEKYIRDQAYVPAHHQEDNEESFKAGARAVRDEMQKEMIKLINERDELQLNESKMDGALSSKQEIIYGLKAELERVKDELAKLQERLK